MLHRADASMIWLSYLFDKKHKWLSYNLWFMYIHFYKVIFFFNFFTEFNDSFLHTYQNVSFILKKQKNQSTFLKKTKPRFSYYMDLYCIEFFNHLLLINLYFYTTLQFYKKKTYFLKKTKKKLLTFDPYHEESFIKFDSSYTNKNDKFLYKTFF
jgi:hypothetical protein